jgi:hypothetical protein
MYIRRGESQSPSEEHAGNCKEELGMKYAFVNGVILDGTQDMKGQEI